MKQINLLLEKFRFLWDKLQRIDIEEDYDILLDASRHDVAVVEEEK